MPMVPINKHRPEQAAACDLVIYCGRGSALGNPFPLSPGMPRGSTLARYAQWLDDRIAERDARVMDALRHIWESQKHARVGLQCFCHPLPCHTNIIIATIHRLWPEEA